MGTFLGPAWTLRRLKTAGWVGVGTFASMGYWPQTCDRFWKEAYALTSWWHDIRFGQLRRELFDPINGRVIELEARAGDNLKYYQPNRPMNFSAVEPNPAFSSAIKRAANLSGRPANIIEVVHQTSMEYLQSQPTASADAIVGSFALASSDHPDELCREILRVLRPLGRYYFVDRNASPLSGCGFWHLFRRLWSSNTRYLPCFFLFCSASVCYSNRVVVSTFT